MATKPYRPERVLVKTPKNGNRLMTKAAFKIAQKFGVTLVSNAVQTSNRVIPDELKAKPLKVNKPDEILSPDPLLGTGAVQTPEQIAQAKIEAFAAFRKELRLVNKEGLVGEAKKLKYPDVEWDKKNKADLLIYLFEKYEGTYK